MTHPGQVLGAAAAVLWLALAAPPLDAAGTPLEYTVFLKKFELKNNTGQWITVIEPDRSVNLAEEEARISFFNTTGRIPDGNYINFRLTISETVKAQGRDEIHVTREGGSVELIGEAETAQDLPEGVSQLREISPSWSDAGAPGSMKVRFTLNPKAGRDDAVTFTRKNDFPEPFTVRKGSFIYAIALPDLADAVQHAQKHYFSRYQPARDAMFVWPIRRVEHIKLTVDERSVEMGPDEILIQY